jgi:hypothetical protein
MSTGISGPVNGIGVTCINIVTPLIETKFRITIFWTELYSMI